jgi:hypothetical protein
MKIPTELKDPYVFMGLSILLLLLYMLLSRKSFAQVMGERRGRWEELGKRFTQTEGFGHGQAIGGRTGGSGAAYQEIGFQDLNEADLIYEKKKEPFRGGGGGEGIGARTGGSGTAYQEIGFEDVPNKDPMYEKKKEAFYGHGEAIGGRTGGSGAAYQEDDFANMTEKDKEQLKEAFENIGSSEGVTGKSETSDVSGPAPASLKDPRKPYNLLSELPPGPRGSISCLKASCCAETDFEWRTNQTGNFLQRTNNYKREFPDNCTAPLTELNLAFYNNEVLRKA